VLPNPFLSKLKKNYVEKIGATFVIKNCKRKQPSNRRKFAQSGVDSSVQKNSDYGQNSDEIYGRKKCFILAFFSTLRP
jgi:hypothetical protein